MKTCFQKEIWLVDWNPNRGSEQGGFRPSLIIQNNLGNKNNKYPNTIIMTISTKTKNLPFHIKLTPDNINNLKSESFVKCEQILTISKDRLIKKIGKINEYNFKEVQKAMNKVIF